MLRGVEIKKAKQRLILSAVEAKLNRERSRRMKGKKG